MRGGIGREQPTFPQTTVSDLCFEFLHFQTKRTDILELLLNAEEVDTGKGLSDSLTQLLSINMDSDAQELKESTHAHKPEENGVKKPRKKKKGLTTEVV